MKNLLWKKFNLLIISSFFLLINYSLPINANENPNLRIGIETSALNFDSQSELSKIHKVSFKLSEGSDGKLVADLVDIFIDETGARQIAPAGATPYSLSDQIEILDQNLFYRASSEEISVPIRFKFKDGLDLKSPIIGGIRLQLITPNSSGIEIRAAAINVVSYLPSGYSTSSLTKSEAVLQVMKPELFLSAQEWLPYRILPNFQFLLNSKQIGVNYEVNNTGNIFLSNESIVTLTRIEGFDQSQNNAIFERITRIPLLMPNEGFEKNLVFSVGDQNQLRTVSAIERYGLYKLEVRTIGSIGTEILTQESVNKWFLILPWKGFTLIFIFLIGYFFLNKKKYQAETIRETETSPTSFLDWNLDFDVLKILEAESLHKAPKAQKSPTKKQNTQQSRTNKKPRNKVAKKITTKNKVKSKR